MKKKNKLFYFFLPRLYCIVPQAIERPDVHLRAEKICSFFRPPPPFQDFFFSDSVQSFLCCLLRHGCVYKHLGRPASCCIRFSPIFRQGHFCASCFFRFIFGPFAWAISRRSFGQRIKTTLDLLAYGLDLFEYKEKCGSPPFLFLIPSIPATPTITGRTFTISKEAKKEIPSRMRISLVSRKERGRRSGSSARQCNITQIVRRHVYI